MSKDILNVATFGVAGSVLKPFGSSAAPAPAVTAPLVMPAADDMAVQAARKKSIALQQLRSGRSSTILTNNSDTLGG